MTAIAALVGLVLTGCASTDPQGSDPGTGTSATGTSAAGTAAAGTSAAGTAAAGTTTAGPPLRYVALGDSAASAPLVPTRVGPVGCLRSDNNYPSVIARTLGAALVDVTCSGARTPDLTGREQDTFAGAVPRQLDAIDADTQLVTVTVGANDVDLAATASRCRRDSLDIAPCVDELVRGGTDTVSAAIDAAAPGWADLLAAIRLRAPGARVVVVGYGTYVPPGGCFPDQPIAPRDADYFQSRIDELDARLAAIAAAAGVGFFDVRAMSRGHDMCAAPAQRWIEGFTRSSGAAPLHPNARGAAAVGGAVAQWLRETG